MAPWGMESVDARTERAMSFISRSLSDVRSSADADIKLMKARAKSFRDLASNLDREWENFRLPSLSGTSTSSSTSSGAAGRVVPPVTMAMSPLAISAQVENINFLKRLRPPTFRRIQSEASLLNTSFSNSSSSSLVTTTTSTGRGVLKDGNSMEEWEPLKRVKESLKDLETTAAASKSPSQFFENVKKTELYENVKNSLLNLPTPSNAKLPQEPASSEVAPLDVPELLENLVRQSEPFLDQLGVRKDVSARFCKMIRRCKRAFSNSSDLSGLETASTSASDELDLRVSSVLQSTGYRYKGGLWGEPSEMADLSDGRRRIAIVTTASLPWMTGTAVNPLFRAAYLAKDGMRCVTLLIPWLSKNDQEKVYPNQLVFSTPQEQESYVRKWVEERVGFPADFKIAFYPGKFSSHKRSILACGDISQFIPDKEADVAILEEPEHLTWYYHGKRWNKKFRDVIGIVHTNYLEYVKREKNGTVQAFFLKHVNNWMVRAYCNKVLRLSAATQELPKSSVCNVHGVSPHFLDIGRKVPAFSKGAYFLGKMIWGKGYRELVDLLAQHKKELGDLKLDVFGSGEDAAEVQSAAHKLGLAIDFHHGRDHADESLHSYKVFINPSISDVVCTTTAEALAMGKIVVCAHHPSNEFFMSFPNCFTYRNPAEFVEKVKAAMVSEPVPLSAEECHRLSWEAATERLLEHADLNKLVADKQKSLLSLPSLRDVVDGGLFLAHYIASGCEPARLVSGAMPGSMHFSKQQSMDLGLLPQSTPIWKARTQMVTRFLVTWCNQPALSFADGVHACQV